MNPYSPGQPVSAPDRFVGRRDLLLSIREGLVKGRRVFLVAGAGRMGKTSLLWQVPSHLPEDHLAVYVAVREEHPQRLDWLLWRLATAISEQAAGPLGVRCPEAAWSDFEGQPERFLDAFWPQMRALLGSRCLVLLLDDADSLEAAGLLETTAAWLAECRERDGQVALVATVRAGQQEGVLRRAPRLFAGAPSYRLGPLSSEDAVRLVTWPVEGTITYDYGIPRRLVEIASGQPYYLQLLCSEVYDRCAPAGWVNQRDVDLVLEGLVGREIGEFRQVWDESSSQEQAVLAALVSLRGARGVATVLETHDILTKAGLRPGREQVDEVLEGLTRREILERLGAHSYRFRVALLRDWLGKRLDAREVMRNTRWPAAGRGQPPVADVAAGRLRAGPERRSELPKPESPKPEPAPTEETPAPEAHPRRRTWPWWVAAAVLVTLLLAAAGAWLLPRAAVPTPTPEPTATVAGLASRPVQTRTVTATVRPAGRHTAVSGAASPLPPTATPSPTAPLIVARPVPSIAYLSKGEGAKSWSVYVMGSDGTNRVPLAEAPSDFFSAPSWSPDGTRIAFVSDRDGNADIWVMDSDGRNAVNLTRNKAKDHTPAWSPDGQWIAFASVRDALYYELYVMRPDGKDVQRLTWWGDASDLYPTWSPDGKKLAFSSKRDGNWEIYVMDRDCSNLVRLTDNQFEDRNPAWSPDGRRIAFESIRDRYADVYVLPIDGQGEAEAVNLTNRAGPASPGAWATDLGPTWSPDGSRLAFYSDRDGEWDVYVMAADGSNLVKLTDDTSSDQLPAWRP